MNDNIFFEIKDRCLAYASDDYMWLHNFVSIVSHYKGQIPVETISEVIIKIIIKLLQEKFIIFLDENYTPILDIDYDVLAKKIRSEWDIYNGNFPPFYMTFIATQIGKIRGREIDNWREK